MSKLWAQFRANVYTSLMAALPAIVAAESKKLKGPALGMAPQWGKEIEFELGRRVKRMAEKLQKLAAREAE